MFNIKELIWYVYYCPLFACTHYLLLPQCSISPLYICCSMAQCSICPLYVCSSMLIVCRLPCVCKKKLSLGKLGTVKLLDQNYAWGLIGMMQYWCRMLCTVLHLATFWAAQHFPKNAHKLGLGLAIHNKMLISKFFDAHLLRFASNLIHLVK